MKAREEPVSGLSLEVKNSSNRSVVLSDSFIQVDTSHLSLREMNSTDVGDSTFLRSVHPDLLADHKIVGVLVENDVGSGGSSKPCLGESSPLKLCRINVL